MPIDTQALLSLLGGATRGYSAQQAANDQAKLQAAIQAQKLADEQAKIDQGQAKIDDLSTYHRGVIQNGADRNTNASGNFRSLADYRNWQIKNRIAAGLGGGNTNLADYDAASNIVNPDAAGIGYTSATAPPALPASVPLPPDPKTGQTGAPQAGSPAQLPAAPPPPAGTVSTGAATSVSGPGPLVATTPRMKNQEIYARTKKLGAETDILTDQEPYAAQKAAGQGQYWQTKGQDQGSIDKATIQHYNAATKMDIATAQALSQTTPAKIAQMRGDTLATGVKLQQEAQRIALQAKQVQIQQQNANTAAGNLGVTRWKAHNPTSGKTPQGPLGMSYKDAAATKQNNLKRMADLAFYLKTEKDPAVKAAYQSEMTSRQMQNDEIDRALPAGQGKAPLPVTTTLPGTNRVVGSPVTHYSNSQPRTRAGHFNGPPARTVRTKSGVYTYTVK